jgi:hypothetical protein
LHSIDPDLDQLFQKKRTKGALIQVRVSRRTLIASILSILLHLLALFFFSRIPKPKPPEEHNEPFNVVLAPPTPTPVPAPPPRNKVILPPEIVKPAEPRQSPKPAPKVYIPPEPITAAPVNPIHIPQPPAPSKPVPPATPAAPAPANPDKFTDLASYMKAKKAQRGATEDTVEEEEQKAETAPIPTGVNGIFQINRIDNRSATFTFRGWKNELSFTHRETYQVDAGLNGDIRVELIRKIIEIIRRFYKGDFNWNSYRLQRVVVLSARPEDNAGLENFLVLEFFGDDGIITTGR